MDACGLHGRIRSYRIIMEESNAKELGIMSKGRIEEVKSPGRYDRISEGSMRSGSAVRQWTIVLYQLQLECCRKFSQKAESWSAAVHTVWCVPEACGIGVQRRCIIGFCSTLSDTSCQYRMNHYLPPRRDCKDKRMVWTL